MAIGANANVVAPGNAQTYMEDYPNLTVVTPGTVQVGYANYWGAAPVAGTPIKALIQVNGWYTFTTTYFRSGNQTTDPAVQISEVLSPCGMLLGYEIGVGIYFAADIPSSDLYGVDQVILESYQPGFAGNNIRVTQVRTYAGVPNPSSSPVISNSGNVAATVGQPFSLSISASQAPTGYQAIGLPPGLSLNATTGVISSIPTMARTTPVDLAAANTTGVGVTTVDIVVAPASVSGSIAGVLTIPTVGSNISLTAIGAIDWAVWGYGGAGGLVPTDRKTTGGSKISALTAFGGGGGGVLYYNNATFTLSWTDRTPLTSASAEPYLIYVAGINQGYSFIVPASTTPQIVYVYLGLYETSAWKLTATLSDGSAAPYVDTSLGDTVDTSQGKEAYYAITYNAASAGQTLTISWVNTTSNGNVTMQGAALAP